VVDVTLNVTFGAQSAKYRRIFVVELPTSRVEATVLISMRVTGWANVTSNVTLPGQGPES
jgi:hypothetical protein